MADTPANVYTAHAERSIQGEFVRALGSIGMGMLASNRALACTSACACTKRGASNDKTDVLLSHPPRFPPLRLPASPHVHGGARSPNTIQKRAL